MKYLLTHDFGEVTIILEARTGNSRGPLQITGDEIPILELRYDFRDKHGAFGHRFDPESTTPIDLSHVLKTQLSPRFKVEILEGAELVKVYDPGIPEGVQT